MKLSIIIPVFNEEKTVSRILAKVNWVKLPKGIEKEIVIVDDGSKDDSKLKIKYAKSKLKIKNLITIYHRTNLGKGAAVRTGTKYSSGDVILIQDADLEYDPEDYKRLLSPILSKKAKVVYGTRLKNYPFKILGRRHTPFLTHFLGNKFLTSITNILYGSNLTDMETCYKVFTTEVAKSLNLKSNRFEVEPEITAKILKKGYSIYEVPIKVTPRGYNEGKKITWRDGFIALWTLFKYRFTD